jgi:hypothetical protein
VIDAKEELSEVLFAIGALASVGTKVPEESHELVEILSRLVAAEDLLAELSTSAVEHQDKRISYVTVQIPTATRERLQAWREKRGAE